MDLPRILLLLDQQIGNEKATQYKKEIHTQVAVLEEALNVIKGIGAGIPDVIEKGHVSMIQEHKEKRNKPQPVEIGKENFFLLS